MLQHQCSIYYPLYSPGWFLSGLPAPPFVNSYRKFYGHLCLYFKNDLILVTPFKQKETTWRMRLKPLSYHLPAAICITLKEPYK